MLLVAIGEEGGVSGWLGAARRHAEWLGLEAETLSAPDAVDHGVGAVWSVPAGISAVRPPLVEDGFLHAITQYHDPRPSLADLRPPELWDTPERARSNDARVLVSLESGELKALAAPATPSQLVYTRVDRTFVITDDIRLLVRELGMDLDPRAVYALLQHGAIPAPLTIARGVNRVLPGHLLHLSTPGSTPTSAPLFRFGARGGDDGPPFSLGAVRAALDRILLEVPPQAVLYFSGGVDSGLFAARLAELGRSDIRLVNLAFGEAKEEATLARRIAAHLELSLEQVPFQPSMVAEVLESLGREYAYPFGDTAVTPARILLNRSLRAARESGVVVEGTGGSLFSRWSQHREWKRVYRIPIPIRRAGSALYRASRLWLRGGRVERVGRVLRRSAQMPLDCAAATALNPLAGIAYRARDGADPDEVDRMLLSVPKALGPELDVEKRITLLALIHTQAAESAAKLLVPLHTRGVAAVHPLLEPSLIELVLGYAWDERFRLGAAKGTLKALLAESVPPDMVYRPKASLTGDLTRTFGEPAIHDFIGDVVLARGAPLQLLRRRRGRVDARQMQEERGDEHRGVLLPVDAGLRLGMVARHAVSARGLSSTWSTVSTLVSRQPQQRLSVHVFRA